MNTMELIEKRRSVRSYLNETVDEDKLKKIIETGKIAPKAGEFHITVIQNKEILNKINDATVNFMENSGVKDMEALAQIPRFNALYGAPVLVLLSAPDENPYAGLTTSCAAENMILAATELELGTCYMLSPVFPLASPDNSELLKSIEVPEGYKPICGFVLGKESPDHEPTKRQTTNNVNYVK